MSDNKMTVMQYATNFPDAIARLVRAIDSRMGYTAYDGVSAEDVVQDVICYRGSFVITSSSPYAQLYRMAMCRMVDVYRHRRIKMTVTADGGLSAVLSVDDDTSTTDLSIAFGSYVAVLTRGMSEKDKQVLYLHIVDGLRIPEIAEMWGVTIGTVKQQRNRAIAKLRENAASYGADLRGLLTDD